MEGPDINIMQTPNGTPYYYLVFAAKVETGNNDTEYIGYAIATPDQFKANPAGCWTFEGWIFKNMLDGWTDHSDLVNYNGKYYIFYHEVFKPAGGSCGSRQVCVKEIEIKNDGRIVGVYPNNLDSIDGHTRSFNKGFVWMRDDSITDSKKSSIFLSYFANKTGSSLGTSFNFQYYVNIEAGKNLVVDNNNQNFSYYLKHLGNNLWAVMFNYTGTTPFDNGMTLPDIKFNLRYDDGSTFNKSDDFSQPISNYNTYTTRIPLFNGNNQLVSGEMPDIPQNSYSYLRTDYTDNNQKSYSYLTCMSQDANSRNQ